MILKPLALAALLIAAAPVFAQNQAAPAPAPLQRIEQREATQQKRIEQGEKSGALTAREAARLERGQAHVEKMEHRAAADGKITGKEAGRIEHAQNVQSRKIHREKHDRQHDFNHDGKKDRAR